MNTKPVFEIQPRVPVQVTSTDVLAEMRQASPARKVYQPAPEWVPIDFGGGMLLFPPDLPGSPLVAHPAERDPRTGDPLMVPANGTLEVRDRVGPIFDSKKRKIKPGVHVLKGHTAMDFVLFVTSSQLCRDKGFEYLRGDGLDETRKAEAKKRFLDGKRQWAENEIQARADSVANFLKQPNTKGQTPPPPSQRQIEAQEFLDEIRARATAAYTYACEHGCWVGNDKDKYDLHMRVSHGQTEAVEIEEPAEVKRGPGRPRKVQPSVQ